jgi:hypothetical protein
MRSPSASVRVCKAKQTALLLRGEYQRSETASQVGDIGTSEGVDLAGVASDI